MGIIKHKGKCKCACHTLNKYNPKHCHICNPTPDKEAEKVHDLMADFMVDLCEKKRYGKGKEREHVCQPNNKLWVKHFKKFELFIKSAVKKEREKIINSIKNK